MRRASSHASSSGTSFAAASTPGFEITPAVLISGIQEKFLVPFRPEDRAVDDAGRETVLLHGTLQAVAGGAVQRGIAHDAAFAHLALAGLELRLDQNDQPRFRRVEQRRQRRKNQGDGDEADVADDQAYRLAYYRRIEIAGVDPLVH